MFIGDAPLVLNLSAGGTLDLHPLYHSVKGKPLCHWGRRWVRELEALHPQTTRVSITSLLHFGLSSTTAHQNSFYPQLVFGLGQVLDRHLVDLGAGGSSEGMQCEFEDLAFETMTAQCYNEFYAVGIPDKLASRPADFLCCGSDKSSVGSLNLTNTPFSVANNTIF